MDLGQYISTLTPPSSAGIPAATPYESGGGAAAGLQKLADSALRMDEAFRAQADDLARVQESESAMLSLAQGKADLEDELEKNPNWQTHEERWRQGFQKLRESVMKPVRDPLVQQVLTTKIGELEATGTLKAKARSRELFFDQDRASLITTLRTVREAASRATDEVEEASLLGIGVGALEARASRGSIKAEEAANGKLLFLQDYYEMKANRDINQDHEKFARDLLAGKYSPFIPPERLEQLEEKYVRVKEKHDKDRQELADFETKRRDAGLLSGALYGEVGQEEADRLLRARLVSAEGHEVASRVIAANWKEEGVSDPQAHNDLLVRMYVSPFSVAASDIATMRANKVLGGKDAREATKVLMDLQETRGGIKDPRYNDGIQKIQKSISRGPMEILSAAAARTMVLDIIEYEDRVLGQKEDPKKVSDEIALRNEERMTGMLTSPIIPFDNVSDLNTAFHRGRVSQPLYNAYLQILRKRTAPKPAAKGGGLDKE